MKRSSLSPISAVVAFLIALGTPSTSQGALAAQETASRIPLRPLRPSPAFRQAVAAGTRAESGRPGEQYWQQRVSYDMDVSFDPASSRVTGRETITYENNSPTALPTLVLHLEQNVYRKGARRNRRVPVTGGVDVRSVRIAGRPAPHRHPGTRYYQSLTLLEITLPALLQPGQKVEVDVEWTFTVPPSPTFRNGNQGGDVFTVAQWYPRLAVYDDVYGWNRAPYLGDGEFYLEYGDFDVRLTLPRGWLVGATGTLQNPAAVIGTEGAAKLLEAAGSDRIVRVAEGNRASADPGPAAPLGPLGPPGPPGAPGPVTWHFTAEDVRDFAWATSASYVWDAVRAVDGVLAQALYRPRFSSWERNAEYAAHTIRTMSTLIGPYAYPQVTVVEGPVGGMEYPMVLFDGSDSSVRGVASTTAHEVGHQWFPMMVGSMEAKHAWMDEGFISYWEELVTADLWGEEAPAWGANREYLFSAGSEREVPIMRHTDLVSPYGERSLAAYRKPAVALSALREVVGDEVFLAAFRDYFASWQLKHPQPWDFFNSVERHAGEDLDWFWRPLFFETDVLDHGIADVALEAGRTTIRIVDYGDVILPTPLRIRMQGGSTISRVIAPARWMDEGREITVTVEGSAISVELDPDVKFPDVDRTNNSWSRR